MAALLCDHWAHAPTIHAARHVHHEKSLFSWWTWLAAWIAGAISTLACGSVLVLRSAAADEKVDNILDWTHTKQTWLIKKGSGGPFNKQSQNITSVWHKQMRWDTLVIYLTLIYSPPTNHCLVFLFEFLFLTVFFPHIFFPLSPWGRFVSQTEIQGNLLKNFSPLYRFISFWSFLLLGSGSHLYFESFLPMFVERKRLRDVCAGRDHLRIVWASSSKPGMRHAWGPKLKIFCSKSFS